MQCSTSTSSGQPSSVPLLKSSHAWGKYGLERTWFIWIEASRPCTWRRSTKRSPSSLPVLLDCLLLITHLHIHHNLLGDRGDYIILYYSVESLFTFGFTTPIFFFCATIRKPFLANIYEKPLHIVVVATSHLLAKVNIVFLKKEWKLSKKLECGIDLLLVQKGWSRGPQTRTNLAYSCRLYLCWR